MAMSTTSDKTSGIQTLFTPQTNAERRQFASSEPQFPRLWLLGKGHMQSCRRDVWRMVKVQDGRHELAFVLSWKE